LQADFSLETVIVIGDSQLLLWAANYNAGRPLAGKCLHQGHGEWCLAVCGKILTAIPSKVLLSVGDVELWTPFNALFLGPTRIHIPNSISIGSAVFARLRIMTDQQTICSNRLHFIIITAADDQPTNKYPV